MAHGRKVFFVKSREDNVFIIFFVLMFVVYGVGCCAVVVASPVSG